MSFLVKAITMLMQIATMQLYLFLFCPNFFLHKKYKKELLTKKKLKITKFKLKLK